MSTTYSLKKASVTNTNISQTEVRLTISLEISYVTETVIEQTSIIQYKSKPNSCTAKFMQNKEGLDLFRRQNRDIKALQKYQKSMSFKTFEDQLFETLLDDEEDVRVSNFLSCLKEVGLQKHDPRLRQCMKKFAEKEKNHGMHDLRLNRNDFKECIKENIVLIKKAFTDDFVIPEFQKFTGHIQEMYDLCKANEGGAPASYIPQLARFDPNYWGVSVCTIDGQRHHIGDTQVPFCLQSTSKPLTYALALNENGPEYVHLHVGQEPSGEAFNVIKLDHENKPHNPMINAGAIVTSSLVRGKERMADRFDYVSQQFKRFAGGEYTGFNNAVYLSERETADRNFALGYYMQENKCFPEGTDLKDTLDFYFQLCSIEVTCESASIIAATLANGGICPLTGEALLSGEAVRNTLSLMHSCGMYDYSGQFAFKVGLPAKSGVSGVILLVVPNVFGMCLWSPPVDGCGNSVRGIQFCEELVKRFSFHHYDNLMHTRQKLDPRKRQLEAKGQEVVSLLFGAFNGDLSALTRMYLSGTDMSLADYDGRTALHLAAAEGHLECIRFLLECCKVAHDPKDRWARCPIEDAETFKHTEVVRYLQNYISRKATAKQELEDYFPRTWENTPMNDAINSKREDVVNYLEKFVEVE